jgi:hypothetical protein
MRPLDLPVNFALQSAARPRLSQVLKHDRGLVALVEADGYPASGMVRIEPLRPERHYRIQGAFRGCCRAGPDGSVRLTLSIVGPVLLSVASVV